MPLSPHPRFLVVIRATIPLVLLGLLLTLAAGAWNGRQAVAVGDPAAYWTVTQ